VSDDRAGGPSSATAVGEPNAGEQGEREQLLAKVRRLESELERFKAHAARTSKLFLAVTDYAEKVREGARRDAEIALRKARHRVERLDRLSRELERTEHDLASARNELARVQKLTEDTRSRLSAFLTTGLEALDVGTTPPARPDTADIPADLDATLKEQLSSVSASPAGDRPHGTGSEQ
jgi:hypothetical protein